VGLVAKVVLVLALLYGALLGGLWAVMHRPVLFGQVMKHVPGPAFKVIPFKQLWLTARAGRLKVGEPAPDFTLLASDKKSRVQLSSFRRHKPVVLVFGSYT